MKNIFRIFTFVVVIFLFPMSSYGDDNIAGIDTLIFSGQVGFLDGGDGGNFQPIEENLPISSVPQGGMGVIVNGQLNFFIGTPAALVPLEEALKDILHGWRSNIISVPDTMGAHLRLYTSNPVRMLRRAWSDGAGFYGADHEIYYIFVDRDVTISARRRVEIMDFISNEVVYDELHDYMAFNILLKAGWNALHLHIERSVGTKIVYELSLPNDDILRMTKWCFLTEWREKYWYK